MPMRSIYWWKIFLDLSTDENVNNQVAQMAATDLDPGNDLPDFELMRCK
jgi:hypothetical protein